jgi:hypothetical protein
MKNFKKKIKDFFEDFLKNIFPKAITKIVKNQVGVAHVILFAPYGVLLCSYN